MKTFRFVLLLSLFLCSVNAFTTKNRKSVNKKREQTQMTPGASPPGSFFAMPPVAEISNAIPLNYEDGEEDLNISYGVAFASCVFSLALGFGFGYGT